MVLKENDDLGTFFVCDACGFKNVMKEWAVKCEKWCREHNSYNLDITKHAIQKK